MADKLGLDLEIYRERNEIYKKYAEQGCVSLEMKAQIFGVERRAFLNEPIPFEEGALPDTISEAAIAEELVTLINEYRVENGLKPLETCDLLQQVADISGTVG